MKHDEDINKVICDTRYSDKNLAFVGQMESPYQYAMKNIKLQLIREYCRGKRVLDMGCGTGGYSILAAEVAEEVVGVDFSENMLSCFRARIKMDNVNNVRAVYGNIQQLPPEIAAGSFDAAICYSVLYIVERAGDVLKEMSRVLKPGGYGIFEMGNLWSLNTLVCRHTETGIVSYHLMPFEMRRIIRKSGLTIVHERCFQLFPMYGSLFRFRGARFLTRFLTMRGRLEQTLFSKEINGKIFDEIISSLPLIKLLAFRYLYICRKDT